MTDDTNPSLYLAHIPTSFGRDDIYRILDQLQFGFIRSIDLVPTRSIQYGHEHGHGHGHGHGHSSANNVFVHFQYWIRLDVKQKILDKETIHIVYNPSVPWVWKAVQANPNPNPNPNPQSSKGIRIHIPIHPTIQEDSDDQEDERQEKEEASVKEKEEETTTIVTQDQSKKRSWMYMNR